MYVGVYRYMSIHTFVYRAMCLCVSVYTSIKLCVQMCVCAEIPRRGLWSGGGKKGGAGTVAIPSPEGAGVSGPGSHGHMCVSWAQILHVMNLYLIDTCVPGPKSWGKYMSWARYCGHIYVCHGSYLLDPGHCGFPR